jgi:hypothetical protein
MLLRKSLVSVRQTRQRIGFGYGSHGGSASFRPRTLFALYLGAFTVVVGRGGATIHRQTRGTLDREVPCCGMRVQRPTAWSAKGATLD